MTPPSPSRIRGILFDKDGTLSDFRSQWMPAYRAAVDMLSPDDRTRADRLLRLGGYDPAQYRSERIHATAAPTSCATVASSVRSTCCWYEKPSSRGPIPAVRPK